MFGIKRRKATEFAIKTSQPIVAQFQNYYGTPPGFWHDPYVLGFIGFLISFHTTETAGIKLSRSDKGYVLDAALNTLSHSLSGVSQEYLRLASSNPRIEAFEKGTDHAFFCVMLNQPKAPKAAIPFYRVAAAKAEADGVGAQAEMVLVYLIEILFNREVCKRFSLAPIL
ncbi:hypothetical protein [Pararhizobium sp. IMCC21322]|uniref:hypothetical protein n=1 Tax=Pararhizobium sp. IMCC21322 TaxID=3067903 RepID=UPI002741A8C8|nr:hypothetical protein [Pararhizobium sp. IMCC21322]